MSTVGDFHLREYVKLWSDLGVEGLSVERFRLARAKRARASDVPVAPTSLDEVRQWIGECTRCGLCKGRQKIVFGSGNPKAKLLFVGEGPGADEDMQGLPFVGQAGKLLTKIIEAMEYRREDFYIANIVKCRPPNNRMPLPEEVDQCLPFLKAQIDIVRPKMIVALGLCAASQLLGTTSSMSNLRGRFHTLSWNSEVHVMPTYHPAYLLRNPGAKRLVWDDMKQVKIRLEEMK